MSSPTRSASVAAVTGTAGGLIERHPGRAGGARWLRIAALAALGAVLGGCTSNDVRFLKEPDPTGLTPVVVDMFLPGPSSDDCARERIRDQHDR